MLVPVYRSTTDVHVSVITCTVVWHSHTLCNKRKGVAVSDYAEEM